MHGREGGKFNKRKDHKSESNAQTFHLCTIIHCMAPCIKYMFSCLKQECRVKKSLTFDKNFRKTFREKEGNLKRSEFSKNLKSQSDWHQSCKSNQVDMHVRPLYL